MERTNTPVAQSVLERLKHVTPVAHAVLDKSVIQARTFFENRKVPVDTFLFPDLVRYEAKCLFDDEKYRSIGYRFTALSQNGLLLIYDYQGCVYEIRIRKADEDGELPTQNLSRTLRRFYDQPTPYFPGFTPEEVAELVTPTKLKLVIVWDVDIHYILTDVFLVCPRTETGDVHFADKIEHAATSISASADFDDKSEELEDIDIEPLESTGTEDNEDEENDDKIE